MLNFPVCLIDVQIIFHLNAFFKNLEVNIDVCNNQYNKN